MIFFGLLFPFVASAWGPVGHRTVGLIAEASLSPNARAGVQRILGGESLANVANWADAIKSSEQYRQTIWYHFEKMPDGVPFVEHLRRMPDEMKTKGGIVEALLVSLKRLRDPATSAPERADALKFFIHFIGDLHQPLHTGRPEDNGGNKVPVVWFGTPMNLHSVWDSGMIMTGHSDLLDPGQSPSILSVIYARYLMTSRRPSVGPDFDLERCLKESLALRLRAYDPKAFSDQRAYQAENLGVIDQRIRDAGFLSAVILNSVFASEPPFPSEINLWRNILAVFPSVERWISLRP